MISAPATNTFAIGASAPRGDVPPRPPLPTEVPPVTPPTPATPAPEVRVQVPLVYAEPRWEYRDLARTLPEQGLPSADELNALGADGWELAATVSDGRTVHYYLKRSLP